jgi:hypothetical protein
MNVTIDVALQEIVDLSEKRETIQLKIWVRLTWDGYKLSWNNWISVEFLKLCFLMTNLGLGLDFVCGY